MFGKTLKKHKYKTQNFSWGVFSKQAFRWVSGQYVIMYLTNLDTQKSFGTVTFDTKYISATLTRSYILDP
jgi:hypothetical protein